jgi:hypothetical protein
LFTGLERNAYAVLVVLALCAAVVLASPARAQAQATSTAEDSQGANANARANARANTSHMVVRPGDSLWSISEERLGPNATPREILNGAEQIHALNRARIGADSDLLFVGQELLVPPAMSERLAGATPADKAAEAAEAGPRDRGAKGTTGKAPGTAPIGGGDTAGVKVPETGVDRKPERSPILPDAAAAAPVPDVGAVAANDAQPLSVASFFGAVRTEIAFAASALTEAFLEVTADARMEGRPLLGLGILVFTLVVAALMAWKLPMKRTTREDTERWMMSYGYYGETPAPGRITPFAYHPGSLGDREEGDAPREAPGALSRGRSAVVTGSEGPYASHWDASRPASEVRGQSAPSGGSKNGAPASEDCFARVGLFAITRAERARVRQKRPLGVRRQSQSPRLRARGLRQPVRARSQRRALSGRRRMKANARRKEWEPSAALVGALKGLPLLPGTGQGEDLARLKPLLGEAFGAMGHLERQRGLSEWEAKRREALRAFMAAIERAE